MNEITIFVESFELFSTVMQEIVIGEMFTKWGFDFPFFR
jgi:hypothetical protein